MLACWLTTPLTCKFYRHSRFMPGWMQLPRSSHYDLHHDYYFRRDTRNTTIPNFNVFGGLCRLFSSMKVKESMILTSGHDVASDCKHRPSANVRSTFRHHNHALTALPRFPFLAPGILASSAEVWMRFGKAKRVQSVS